MIALSEATEDWRIELSGLTKRDSLFPSEGFHTGLHHRARLHGEAQAGVRQAEREGRGPVGGSSGQAQHMVQGHRGDAGPRAELSDDWRSHISDLETLRYAPRDS